MTNQIFEIFGYSKDYYVNGRYVGSINLTEPDRETLSYHGRRPETVNDLITFTNKKKIKPGTSVVTELIPLCGRMLKK